MVDKKNGIVLKLNEFDSLFEGLFAWLARQYDDSSGGFYYARSSIESSKFQPDIESTSQALNILIRNNLLEVVHDDMKENIISFFQKKQDPRTGYFYDKNEAMRLDEVMVHRAINYSIGSLRKLGSVPLYPLPLHANAAPNYVRSPETYLEKWKSIDLSNSWRGCDLLASSCVYIGQMSKENQERFLEKAFSYLESIQDSNTGLWGDGSLYVRISGTFKLHTFYNKYGVEMPRANKIYDSILQCLRTEEASDMCYIRNPIDLLSYLNLDIPINELEEIISITTKNITKLKREDGAFSREIGNSPSAPNVAQVKNGDFYPDMPKPVHLSNGRFEGDMNASTQATLIRLQLYKLSGIELTPLQYRNEFIQTLQQIKEIDSL